MILIVGLGNPGEQYKNTRHNVGFIVADYLSSHFGFTFGYKAKFNSEIAEGYVCKHKILLAKPLTYMNLSGNSVKAISMYYHISPQSIYIIHDDIDLELGRIKCKLGGGNGGHNGLKSIDSILGTNYYRIRIGISKATNHNISVVNHVLSSFTTSEYEIILNAVKKITQNVDLLIAGQWEEFKKMLA